MEKNKLIGEMYGVIIALEEEFEGSSETDFNEYSKKRVLELYNNALEWRAEDEREKSESIDSE